MDYLDKVARKIFPAHWQFAGFIVPLLIGFAVLWFFAWQNGMGATIPIDNPDSTWVEAKSLVYEPPTYVPKAVYFTCPHCGKCKPNGGDFGFTTLMYCYYGCCNTTSLTYKCQTTCENINVCINECDWVEWLVKRDSLNKED